MNTVDVIKQILADNLNIEAEINDETTFADLNIDSLDTVELICNLEDEFNIDLGDLDDVNTLGQLIARIDALRA